HAAREVPRGEPAVVEPCRGAHRAATRPADDEEVLLGELVEASGQLAERDVGGARDVPGVPLVLLAHVEHGVPGRDGVRGVELTDGEVLGLVDVLHGSTVTLGPPAPPPGP